MRKRILDSLDPDMGSALIFFEDRLDGAIIGIVMDTLTVVYSRKLMFRLMLQSGMDEDSAEQRLGMLERIQRADNPIIVDTY